ncbi:MAG: nucleotide sugar dehydrogenase [Candidatus Bathyarchaeia archaeon]
MSLNVLHLKQEDLDTLEKRANYTVSVVGCKHAGVFHAWLAIEKGFKVYCADADRTVLNGIAKGKMPFIQNEIALKMKNCVKSGILNLTTDIKMAAAQSNIIIITIPVEVDDKGKANYSKIENVCKQVGLGFRRGSLVILTSTVGVGIVQSLIRESLENASGLKCGVDFGLAYSPIKSLDGQMPEAIRKGERVVAAFDMNSLNAASTFLEAITECALKKTLNVKAAEVAAIFEAIQNNVNVALAREFAVFCEKAGIDHMEVAKLSRSETVLRFSAAYFDDTYCVEPRFFFEDSETFNIKARILKAANDVNAAMAKHAANLVRDALKGCSKTMRRARIAVLGITRLRNTKAPWKGAALELIRMLNAVGARLSVYDPYVTVEEAHEISNLKRSLVDALEGADCAVILTGHEVFRSLNLKELKVIMKMPAAIVDLEGIVEPFTVEKEGFIYRGLGRGVWTK